MTTNKLRQSAGFLTAIMRPMGVPKDWVALLADRCGDSVATKNNGLVQRLAASCVNAVCSAFAQKLTLMK